ncbi:ribokinase [Corynebacterium sp. sy017]|uniref:ribokinase n=1 Tax=unclassified Corynebacterium TaxID=2624378 RepID=UPI0011867A29|nr:MULTISPECIES: ribokinase [unclassified Corynebacterium]MBP3088283.1 ribokinase [Corynebacterium sp. sy017]TSD91607.1 ribokinase [Corynebacterium sp. SY003]
MSKSHDDYANLVVVGSINADLMVSVQRHPSPGETLMGSGGDILAGGKGANQAVAAALQGASVSFIGAVGDDAYAGAALSLLESSGVRLDQVLRAQDTTTGLAVITVSADGENSIIVIPGANALVNRDVVYARQELIAQAHIVLLQGEIPAEGMCAAVDIARAAGTRVVINLAPVIEVDSATLLQADPLVVNEHEAGLVLAQLGEVESTTEENTEGNSQPHELVTALLAAGFPSVVLTLGAQGAAVAATAESASGQVDYTAIATPRIHAVDTTGAGDAFTGALVSQLLEGADLVSAAQYAARVGAFAALGHGAQPSYPHAYDTLPEVTHA